MDLDLAIKLLSLPVLLFSIICHELGHAYAAYLAGDDTARLQGRVTLNPLSHIDPIGTVLIPLVQIFSPVRLPLIGWAKPVPVNPLHFKSVRWDLVVSLAGVAMNMTLILGAAIIVKILLLSMGMPQRPTATSGLPMLSIVHIVLLQFIMINSVLIVFNLIPIPPLDGSHVLLYFVRARNTVMARVMEFLERFGFMILILLVFTNLLGLIIFPALNFALRGLSFFFNIPLFPLFNRLFS